MSIHLFANIVTPFGTAANNRGETEGNTTTLQKLIWHGQPHTSVSAEAIRFALRRRLHDTDGVELNRYWDDDTRRNEWNAYDSKTKSVAFDTDRFFDDDLLGYMSAEAAREEAGETKGTANVRRSVLEITRAVSLTPWSGDVVFNAASPRATPAAAKGEGDNPVPYAAEVHATRYQYGVAMTPSRLADPTRAATAIRCLAALGEVAGNQARFLYDFSPESIVLRITDDPAPRLLYCFDTRDNAKTVTLAQPFSDRVGDDAADIRGDELILGGAVADTDAAKDLKSRGATLFPHGVKAAVEAACERLDHQLNAKGA